MPQQEHRKGQKRDTRRVAREEKTAQQEHRQSLTQSATQEEGCPMDSRPESVRIRTTHGNFQNHQIPIPTELFQKESLIPTNFILVLSVHRREGKMQKGLKAVDFNLALVQIQTTHGNFQNHQIPMPTELSQKESLIPTNSILAPWGDHFRIDSFFS